MDLQTLDAAIDSSAYRHSDRLLFASDSQHLTYGGFRRAVSRMARVFKQLGVEPGSRVVCKLHNRPELLIAAVATWQRGALLVLLDPSTTEPEISHAFSTFTPTLVVGEMPRLGLDPWCSPVVAQSTNGELTALSRDVVDDLETSGGRYLPVEEPLSRPTHPALVLLTSGTTGRPKAVIRYHAELLRKWNSSASTLAFTSKDIHLAQLPLTHGFGFGQAVAAILSGGRLALMPRFEAETALEIIRDSAVSILHGTPTHFSRLYESYDPAHHDLSSLRAGWASGAHFSPELFRRILDCFPLQLHVGYGSSEGLGWSTSDREDILLGSVGRPPRKLVRIVDGAGSNVPSGEVGQIEFRVRRPVQYWGTSRDSTIEWSWHSLGDLGCFDSEGRLHVTGRAANQISRGGLLVDAVEVEAVLLRYPDIVDVGIVPVPHHDLGAQVCACVVAQGAAQVTLADLQQYCIPLLARYKIPERLCLMPTLRRGADGQLDRAFLRNEAQDRYRLVRFHGTFSGQRNRQPTEL